MGQKVNPRVIRLGINKDWQSVWYAEKSVYPNYLIVDRKVRDYIKSKFAAAGINAIVIERPAKNAVVVIYAAKPGVIVGKKGDGIDELRKALRKMIGLPVHVRVEEVKKPDLESQLIAEGIAQQLEKRTAFRRAMKRAAQAAFKAGALGVKINVSGRLGGAEIARSEWLREKSVPLHTFRADIDYGFAEAKTTYGIIGVKVWLYKGAVFEKKREK